MSSSLASVSTELKTITDDLCRSLAPLSFSDPVAHVYNPLEYARKCWDQYLDLYARSGAKAMLLGMNPGPWGMVQTGVPFGEVEHVREWLNITGPVEAPATEHPARPIQGLECTRSEVSGARLWSWAEERFGKPERFFKLFFVANYCPLAFLEDSGRNRTPDKLAADERKPLFDACDDALRKMVEVIRPEMLIGVGTFAEKRLKTIFPNGDYRIGRILHPSPASPKANKGWATIVTGELQELGILQAG